MHEVGLMQAVMDEISRAARENNLRRVTRVCLVVGRLNGALPEALEFAFTVLSPGTVFADAALEIVPVPVTLRCLRCGESQSTGGVGVWLCPLCGGPVEILSGRELYIDYFEGDEGKEDAGEGGNGSEDLAG